MAQLNEVGIPGIGAGILHPLVSYQFQIRFGRLPQEDGALLSKQAINARMNFKDKTISIDIQQPLVYGSMVQIVSDLVERPGTITVDAMDGNGNAASSYVFDGLECASHNFDLDYAGKTRVATHQLVFKYRHLMTAGM